MPNSDMDLMLIRAKTLYVHDANEDIVYVNRPIDPERYPAPALFVGRTIQGAVVRFSNNMPSDFRMQIEDVVKRFESSPLTEYNGLKSALVAVAKRHIDVGRVSTGPAYRFPDVIEDIGPCVLVDQSNSRLLLEDFDDYILELDLIQPCVVAYEEGRAVSICHSSRATSDANEAGVDTLEQFRRLGLGARVVAKWASSVREAGRVPFYSTSWDNEASRSLAASLGLVMYGSDLQIYERKES